MRPSAKNIQLATITENDPRWASVVARDPQPPLKFCYSVKTTGVYCRPSCAARLPNPENVQFHATCEDAEKAGFRPCKRCKPTVIQRGSTEAELRTDERTHQLEIVL
jgi:AraC family transcriptional regulator of adaptative response/methylated-DNA-[protein]-cysteine methyltransferase